MYNIREREKYQMYNNIFLANNSPNPAESNNSNNNK